MTDPRAYNRAQIALGKLTTAHVDLLLEEGTRAVQLRAGLDVDGQAGDDTRKALDALLHQVPSTLPAPSLPPSRAIVPVGKGVFVRGLPGGKTPLQLAQELAAAGCTFAELLRVWQNKARNEGVAQGKQLPRFADALRLKNIDPWLWGWPVPGQEQRFVDLMCDTAVAIGAKGVVADPELPFKGKPEAAAIVIQLLEERCDELSLGLGVSSYGQAQGHPTFPWRTFGGHGHGCPQVYVDAAEHPGKTTRAIESWRSYGWEEIVAATPLWGVSPALLVKLLAEAKAAGAHGYVGWSIENARARRDLWRAFAAFEP